MPPLSELDARAIVNNLLQEFDLSFSEAQVQEWVGLFTDNPDNLILIEQEIRDSEEFQLRFPGLQQRVDNGLPAILPREYLDLERTFRATLRNAGLPQSFWDGPEDFANLIANDVAPLEFEERVEQGLLAAQAAPDEIKFALEDFYGIEDSVGALAAFFLDPERGLEVVQKQFRAAQIAGTANIVGFGGLTRGQAERLADLGVDQQRAQQGLGELARSRELTQALPGEESGRDLSTDDQLRAIFQGDQELLGIIEQTRRRRQAAFEGNRGGAATTAEGVVGLRSTGT